MGTLDDFFLAHGPEKVGFNTFVIDEDGNALFLRDGADTADAQRALFCSRAGEDIDHRGAIGEFGA